MLRTGLLSFLLEGVKPLSFWPGGNLSVDEISGNVYKKKSKDRLRRVLGYCNDKDFELGIVIVLIGSLPRWHLCRAMEKDVQKGPGGVNYGVKKLCDDISKIFRCENNLVNNVLETCKEEEEIPRIRLQAYRVLRRTACFLSERMSCYSSPLWRGLLGEISIEESVDLLDFENLCCSCSALDKKAFSYMNQFDGNLDFC